MIKKISFLLLICFGTPLFAQNILISGTTSFNKEPLPFVNIIVQGSTSSVTSDADGKYSLRVSSGDITLIAQAQGYRTISQKFKIQEGEEQEINFVLQKDVLGLDEVVVSATRNRVVKRSAPVVVSTLKPRLLTATQSITLADGLDFSPGVRVETNCQNC